jgi:delta(3,5)-delta(2,4)-dienoyl-CoA isomerase
MMKLAPELAEQEDVARKAKILMKSINAYQKSLSWLELCKKPVLAAIHSACVGGGVDLVTVADMRYCTKDAWFQVKEVGNSYLRNIIKYAYCNVSYYDTRRNCPARL